MKKFLSIAIIAIAASAVAEDIVVATVGVTAITSSLKNTIVSVPYTELGTTGGNICVSNIIKTANLEAGDIVSLFTDSQYKGWILTAGANGAKYWAPLATATIADGVMVGVPAGTETLAPGTALWLVKAQTPNEGFTFYVYGNMYTSNPTTNIQAGNNLVANPLQGNASFSYDATKGDMITVPNDTANPDIYTYNGTTWFKKVKRGQIPTSGAPTLAPGRGFWYCAKGSGTMSWEVVP